MITSEKQFGSYKLVKCDYYQDNNTDGMGTTSLESEENGFISDCAVGPTWTPLELLTVTAYNHDTRYILNVTSFLRKNLHDYFDIQHFPICATKSER
jgi:hypothetical protein